MKPECTVIAYLTAKPERRAELLAILQDAAKLTRTEPGCVDYHLHVSNDDPNLIVFYENWETRKDVDDHVHMPYIEAFSAKAHDLLAKNPDLRFLTMLSDMP